MANMVCPHCGSKFTFKDELLGRRSRCNACQGMSLLVDQGVFSPSGATAREAAERTPLGVLSSEHPQRVAAICHGCGQATRGYLIPDGRFICPTCHPAPILQRWEGEWGEHEKTRQREELKRRKELEAEASRKDRAEREARKAEDDRLRSEQRCRQELEARQQAEQARIQEKARQEAVRSQQASVPPKPRRAWVWACALAAVLASGFGGKRTYDHYALQAPMDQVLAEDPRNTDIEVSVYYASQFDVSAIVYDLRGFRNKSPADLFRAFLQFSSKMKAKDFARVVLATRGEVKFMMEGRYFKQLGQEFEGQNPIYTVRTFPSHLYQMDGKQAYGEWTGGLLGVVKEQMEDFNDFMAKWAGAGP